MDNSAILQTILETQQQQGATIGEIHSSVTNMQKELLGNGQPGRMKLAENRLTELEEHKNKSIGYIAGASSVAGLFGGLVTFLLAKLHIFTIK